MFCMLGHLLMGNHSAGQGQGHEEKDSQKEVAALREEVRALKEALASKAKGRQRRRPTVAIEAPQHSGH